MENILKEIEKLILTTILRANRENKLRTAQSLGLNRGTLYEKLYRYGLLEPKAKRRDV